jgi:hypothetical protein
VVANTTTTSGGHICKVHFEECIADMMAGLGIKAKAPRPDKKVRRKFAPPPPSSSSASSSPRSSRYYEGSDPIERLSVSDDDDGWAALYGYTPVHGRNAGRVVVHYGRSSELWEDSWQVSTAIKNMDAAAARRARHFRAFTLFLYVNPLCGYDVACIVYRFASRQNPWPRHPLSSLSDLSSDE